MSYISEIRKKVGHDQILSVACGAILENEKQEILLQFRKDTKNFGIPGGNVELGEKLIEALIREVKEETGIILEEKNCKLFGIYSGKECAMVYPNLDQVQYIVVIFYCRISSLTPLSNQEAEADFIRFYPKDALPKNLKKSDKLWISDFVNGKTEVVVR